MINRKDPVCQATNTDQEGWVLMKTLDTATKIKY